MSGSEAGAGEDSIAIIVQAMKAELGHSKAITTARVNELRLGTWHEFVLRQDDFRHPVRSGKSGQILYLSDDAHAPHMPADIATPVRVDQPCAFNLSSLQEPERDLGILGSTKHKHPPGL